MAVDEFYQVISGSDGKKRLYLQPYRIIGKRRQATKKDIRKAYESLNTHKQSLDELLIDNFDYEKYLKENP